MFTAFTRPLAAVVVTGAAMLCIGSGIAAAAPAPAVVGAVSAGHHLMPGSTSSGIHLQSYSQYANFVLTGVSGENDGVPAVGTSIRANSTDSMDFEVTYRFAKTTTVTAEFDVIEMNDQMQEAKVGTMEAKFSVDGWDDPSTTVTYTQSGSQPLEVKLTGGGSQDPTMTDLGPYGAA